MVTVVKSLQPAKANAPISVTPLGMVIDVKLLQPEKAETPILLTPSGIFEFLQPATNVLVRVPMIQLQLLRESYKALSLDTTIELNSQQPSKIPFPMVVTLWGIDIEVKPQNLKALSPMLVTLLGMVIEVSLEQLPKASFPMLVTLLGMVTEIRLRQPQKA
jgi:hypothetical protein